VSKFREKARAYCRGRREGELRAGIQEKKQNNPPGEVARRGGEGGGPFSKVKGDEDTVPEREGGGEDSEEANHKGEVVDEK